jgi:hypothetical protein
MKATVLRLKRSITGEPYFALGIEEPGKCTVVLSASESAYSRIQGPEDFFGDIASRINYNRSYGDG